MSQVTANGIVSSNERRVLAQRYWCEWEVEGGALSSDMTLDARTSPTPLEFVVSAALHPGGCNENKYDPGEA